MTLTLASVRGASAAWRRPSPARPTRPTQSLDARGQADRRGPVPPPQRARRRAGRDIRRPTRSSEVAAVAGVDPEAVLAVVDVFRDPDLPSSPPPGREAIRARRHPRHQPREPDPPLGPAPRLGRHEATSAEMYRRLDQTARLWSEDAPACGAHRTSTRPCAGRRRRAPTQAWAARYGGDFERAMRFPRGEHRRAERSRTRRRSGRPTRRSKNRRLAEFERRATARTGPRARRRGCGQAPEKTRFNVSSIAAVVCAPPCRAAARRPRRSSAEEARAAAEKAEAAREQQKTAREAAANERGFGERRPCDRDLASARRPLRVGAEQAPGPLAALGGRSSPDREHLRGTR